MWSSISVQLCAAELARQARKQQSLMNNDLLLKRKQSLITIVSFNKGKHEPLVRIVEPF